MRAQMCKIEDNQPVADPTGILEIVEPLEANSVLLSPGEVKTVWMDRKFLKAINRGSRFRA